IRPCSGVLADVGGGGSGTTCTFASERSSGCTASLRNSPSSVNLRRSETTKSDFLFSAMILTQMEDCLPARRRHSLALPLLANLPRAECNPAQLFSRQHRCAREAEPHW